MALKSNVKYKVKGHNPQKAHLHPLRGRGVGGG